MRDVLSIRDHLPVTRQAVLQHLQANRRRRCYEFLSRHIVCGGEAPQGIDRYSAAKAVHLAALAALLETYTVLIPNKY
jgi:hypothetical protein